MSIVWVQYDTTRRETFGQCYHRCVQMKTIGDALPRPRVALEWVRRTEGATASSKPRRCKIAEQLGPSVTI
ncbi:hypothetical protein [Rosistilla ulvae]|uniref:hypothetical protein n=1 Tax=Rosistilla ulvae TaxID=1930277 RepID=UPI0011A89090|nr:hypothetical protein [Rosistilla ulvae]